MIKRLLKTYQRLSQRHMSNAIVHNRPQPDDSESQREASIDFPQVMEVSPEASQESVDRVSLEVPQEVIDSICEYIYNEDFYVDSRYHLHFPVLAPTRQTQHDLAQLRLVNQAFSRGAGCYLFRHFDARFPAQTNQDRIDVTEWQETLTRFTCGPHVRHVRSLTVGFPNDDFVDSGETSALQDFLVASAYTLPQFVQACTGLRSIRFYVRSKDVGFNADKTPDRSRSLSLNTIKNVLRECSSMLKSVEIHLPLTWDFGALEKFLSQSPELTELLARLTAISLSIEDDSGAGGSRFRERSVSKNQNYWPNELYEEGFWRFAALAKHLQILHLNCTHILDFDKLDIGGLTSLRELKMTAVKVSSSKLRMLIQQNSITLTAIEIWDSRMEHGSWANILTELCSVPNLVTFNMDSCTYQTFSRPSDDNAFFPELWNLRNITRAGYPDYDALGALQRHVNAVREEKGLELYESRDFRFMDWH